MDAHYQSQVLLRLAAAAALETHAGYTPHDAWTLSGQLPQNVREELRDAASHPLRSQAGRDVREILERWEADQRRREPTPYHFFAEPV